MSMLLDRLRDAEESVTLFSERWRHFRVSNKGYGQWKSTRAPQGTCRTATSKPASSLDLLTQTSDLSTDLCEHGYAVCDDCMLVVGPSSWGQE